ncbi:SoxR reducing system RseC family protein [Alteromonas sp. 1_MG-2023]|uniref:SoxR reducing system RseC family protein n=1 Tax=Alteromonas sp. 1_MG-2023 TaxID=3062669 RepID=UPI0026E26D79|nr:SoxR reducing system RseC family protein [Alteromonas sp. 1_MG-2023]MDO6566186.1 SoxR reducing system RseC family protein [Alteromonas sp. 1_MG-2023]
MITETARVVAVDGDLITVEAAIKSTCSSCQAQSDCGTGAISRALAPKTQQLTLRSPMPVTIGQDVTVGVPEEGVLSASAWLYLLPLLIFIAIFAFANATLPSIGLNHELWGLIPSIALTLITYKAIAFRLKRLDRGKFQPVLLNTV